MPMHCNKKVSDIPVSSRDVAYQTLPEAGIIWFFPPREGLVSDIPDGDGNVANLFLQCDGWPRGEINPFFADHQLCAWHPRALSTVVICPFNFSAQSNRD